MNDENKKKDTGDGKLCADGIKIEGQSKALKWLENFWFHYKWPVIIGVFFAVVLTVGLVQIFSRTSADAYVAYAGNGYISAQESENIRAELSKLLPEDINGDGDKHTTFRTYTVYSEDDIKGDGSNIDLSQNSTNKSNYESYMNSGECSIYFVSGYLLENLVQHDRLKSMSDIFGDSLPQGVTDDGYAVRLGDLPIYELDAMRVMPEDTYVCLLKPYIYGESSKADSYAASERYFKAIVGFGS